MPATPAARPPAAQPVSPSPQSAEIPPKPPTRPRCRMGIHNRVAAVMTHAPRYAFMGKSRLARDAQVSRSTITRLLSGRAQPSYALACAVTRALEMSLHRRIDPRDLFSLDGTYPTPSGCQLAGCRGCFPDAAYDGESRLKPEYRGHTPGDWSRSPEPDSYLDLAPPALTRGLHSQEPGGQITEAQNRP